MILVLKQVSPPPVYYSFNLILSLPRLNFYMMNHLQKPKNFIRNKTACKNWLRTTGTARTCHKQ